jgi:hypothetical protein
MDLPLQLIVLSIPSLIYVAVRRRRGEKGNEVLRKIGWQGSRPIYFLWSLGVILIAGGLGWLAFQTVPSPLLRRPISISSMLGTVDQLGACLKFQTQVQCMKRSAKPCPAKPSTKLSVGKPLCGGFAPHESLSGGMGGSCWEDRRVEHRHSREADAVRSSQ